MANKKPSNTRSKVVVKKPAKAPKAAGLARRDPREPTVREVARAADDVIDEVNRLVGEQGDLDEQIANLLFKELFNNDAAKALAPDKKAARAYRAVRARAGKSLKLSRVDLSRYVRVGALNHRFPEPIWLGLDFSRKVRLLSLVKGPDDDLSKLRTGLAVAVRRNVSLDALEEYVARNSGRGPNAPGRPAGPTVAGGINAFGRMSRFGDDKYVGPLASKVKALSPAKQRAFLRELDEALTALGKLRAEFGDDD